MARKPRPQRVRREKAGGQRPKPPAAPKLDKPVLPRPAAPFSAGGPNGAWWPTLLWLMLFASAWAMIDESLVWSAMVMLWFIGMMASIGYGKLWTWPFWTLWIIGTFIGMVGQLPAMYAGLACGLIALYWTLRRLRGRNGGLPTAARLPQALVAALALCVGIGAHALTAADVASLRAQATGGRPANAAPTLISASALITLPARRGDLLAVQGRGHCQAYQESVHRVYFDCMDLGWRLDSVPAYLFDRQQELRAEVEPVSSSDASIEAMRLAALLTRRPVDAVVVRVPVGGERKRPWSFSVVDPTTVTLDGGDVAGPEGLQRVRDQAADLVPFDVSGRLLDRWKTANGAEFFVIDARPAALHVNPLVWTAGVLGVAFLLLGWHGSELVARATLAWKRRRRRREVDRQPR